MMHSLTSLISYFAIFVVWTSVCSTNGKKGKHESVFVTTKHGKLVGLLNKTVKGTVANVFLGVPFAQPPIGNLRFEYPKEMAPWTGIYNATYLRSTCIQTWVEESTESEDCLYLNIYSPQQHKQADGYPVLVWIHGGSFSFNDASNFHVDGVIDNLVSRGIVVVFMNYRLGFLGFATTLNNNLPGNFGLEDQLMAVKWVNENIDKFSGNPNAVTLVGDSAGAVCVSLLGISPKVKKRGYFKKLIMRSGSALAFWAMRSDATKNYTLAVLKKLGCNDDTGVKDCLRNVKQGQLKNLTSVAEREIILQRAFDGQVLGSTLVTPVKDHYRGDDSILPKCARELMMDNAHLPIMTGTTASEAAEEVLWQIATANKTEKYDMKYFIPLTNYKDHDRLKTKIKEYYGIESNMKENKIALIIAKLVNDNVFIYPSIEEGKIYAQKGHNVYAYIFSRLNDDLKKTFEIPIKNASIDSADHQMDQVYLFQSSDVAPSAQQYTNKMNLTWDEVDLRTIKFLADSIYNFVSTGNASVENFMWPNYRDIMGHNAVNINGIGNGAELVNYYHDTAKFWYQLNKEFYNNWQHESSSKQKSSLTKKPSSKWGAQQEHGQGLFKFQKARKSHKTSDKYILNKY